MSSLAEILGTPAPAVDTSSPVSLAELLGVPEVRPVSLAELLLGSDRGRGAFDVGEHAPRATTDRGLDLELEPERANRAAGDGAIALAENGKGGGAVDRDGVGRAAEEIERRAIDHERRGDPVDDGGRSGVAHAPTVTISDPERNKNRPTRERLADLMAKCGDPGALLGAARATLARRKLSAFVRQGWHVLEPGVPLEWWWHLDMVCDSVQAMLEGWLVCKGRGTPEMVARQDAAWKRNGLERKPDDLLVQNLAINVPPGTLKSRILMVFAPAWMWLHAPGWTMLATSGNPENVKRDSHAHRDLVESRWYRETFGIQWVIRDDVDAVDKWSTTAGGERSSRGFISSFTGIHVDAIFVDDPDDAHKVFSEPARREVHDKWSRAIKNRVNSLEHSIRIGIQQRVHVDDWTSYVTGKGSWSPTHRKAFAHLILPMEFGKGPANSNAVTPWGTRDPRTAPGEVLHPQRFTPQALADERVDKGSAGYAAQYNQNPDSLEGGAINRAWFRWCRIAGMGDPRPRPDGCSAEPAFIIERHKSGALKVDSLTISVDATFGSTSDTASAVGLLAVANIGARRCILDDRTEPMTFLDTVKALRKMIADWGPGRILIEKKANGAAVIEQLAALMAAGDLLGPDGKPIAVVVEAIEPEGGKESRAAAMIPAIEAGLVFLLEGAAWLEIGRAANDEGGFLGEVCRFPNARRDDRVDALSQLMTYYGLSSAAGRLLALCVA